MRDRHEGSQVHCTCHIVPCSTVDYGRKPRRSRKRFLVIIRVFIPIYGYLLVSSCPPPFRLGSNVEIPKKGTGAPLVFSCTSGGDVRSTFFSLFLFLFFSVNSSPESFAIYRVNPGPRSPRKREAEERGGEVNLRPPGCSGH